MFIVNPRSIRDRFNTLTRKVKAKLATEERASGGGEVLQSEPDKLVEELITLRDESEKESEEQSGAKTKAVANEKKQALEITDRALEGIGETRKRNEQERAEEKKTVGKKRRSGGDMLEWPREREESDLEIKKHEIKEKREERAALGATRLEQQQQQQHQQKQQLALMQQQMMGMFQQQRQQMQPLLSFLPKKE